MVSCGLVEDERDRAPTVTWLSRRGPAVAFVWAVAEATIFFLVPDVIIGASALSAPRRWWRVAAAAVAGSLAGGLVLWSATLAAAGPLWPLMDAVPGVSPAMIERVEATLADGCREALLTQPFSGAPYKLYVTGWSQAGCGTTALVLWTLVGRALRLVPVAAVAGGVGVLLRPVVRARPGIVLGLYLAAWAAFYAAYFLRVGW